MEFDELPEEARALIDEACAAMSMPKEALALWRRIAETYPKYLPGRLNYASVLLDAEGPDAARAVCDAIEGDVGERPELAAQRALIELEAGRPEVALELADRALAGGYDWPALYGARGEALAKLGRTEEAKPALLESYRREPHAWKALQRYCELSDLPFVSPLADPSSPIDALERLWLYAFIERQANTPDDEGNTPGCNHTLRFVDLWCDSINQDPIPLYQYLNARGGFCDCEVIYNVEEKDGQFERIGITGAIEADDDTIAHMLKTGVVVVTDGPPDLDAHEEEEDAVIAVERQPGALTLWPQLARGRAVGNLIDMSTVFAGKGAAATLICVAPDDDGARRLWIHGAEGYWVRNLTDGDEVPPDVRERIDIGFAMLDEMLPGPPPTVWTEPLELAPARPDVPRLLFVDEEFGQRLAYGDGEIVATNLTEVFSVVPSPDGRHLAFTMIGRSGETLVVADVRTGRRRRIRRSQTFSSVAWIDAETLYASDTEGGHYLAVDGRDLGAAPEGALHSRDGTHLAYADDGGLVVATRSGQIVHRLPEEVTPWSWSLDGRSLTVTASHPTGHRAKLWDVGEATARPLHGDDCFGYEPYFVADGEHIVMTIEVGEDASRIAIVQRSGGRRVYESPGPNDESIAVHPTLPWIAWECEGPAEDGPPRISVRTPAGQVRVLEATGSEPLWLPT